MTEAFSSKSPDCMSFLRTGCYQQCMENRSHDTKQHDDLLEMIILVLFASHDALQGFVRPFLSTSWSGRFAKRCFESGNDKLNMTFFREYKPAFN